jgi:serine/threonine kinase 32
LACRTGISSIDEIKYHPWFSQLDWQRLEAKHLEPPFVPSVSFAFLLHPSPVIDLEYQQDRSNFDVSHELDEFMLAEKPLTHHKRKANPEKMKPEMRQLEDNFMVYDFERTVRQSYYPLNEHLIARHSRDGQTRPVLASQTNSSMQTSTLHNSSRSSSPSGPTEHSHSHSHSHRRSHSRSHSIAPRNSR